MVKFVLDDANHLDINHIPEHLVLPRQSHGTKDRPTAVFVTQSLTRSYLDSISIESTRTHSDTIRNSSTNIDQPVQVRVDASSLRSHEILATRSQLEDVVADFLIDLDVRIFR